MKRIESFLIKEETLHNVMKLKTMVKEDDALAVLMFGSPDPDAVASCMALQELLRQTAGLTKCIFAATEPVVRQQNIEFIRAMKVDVQLLNKVDIRSYPVIAIVDAQPTFLAMPSKAFSHR